MSFARINGGSAKLSDEYVRVQDCFIETNHGHLGYIVLTNQAFWEKLGEPLQKSLKEKLDKVTEKVNEIAERYNANARRQIEKEKSKSIVQFKRE
ncbi:MAG: hypothetical protein BWK79_02545 [Beggiatoa sp. IS2]|nr:MAG: hypothetical protein BWK79_02545 [Beggiatoa sp. IS2]